MQVEDGVFGLATSGVFSNADVEAGVAGQKFYNDLEKSARKGKPLDFNIEKYHPENWNENKILNKYDSAISEIIKSNEKK